MIDDADSPHREVGRRLSLVLDKAGLTQGEGAKLADVTPKTFARWLRGDSKAEGLGLSRIADHASVELRWIITGEGEPHQGSVAYLAPEASDSTAVPVRDVQLSGGAGHWPTLERTVGHVWFPKDIVRPLGDPKYLDIVQVRGDSMSPELNDGDYVILNTDPDRIGGPSGLNEGVVATFFEGMLHVKRLRIVDAKSGEMISTNPSYPPVPVPLNDEGRFRVQGRVVYKMARL